MILWIENYSNKRDNAGYKVMDLNEAALFSTASFHYGINNPCGILTEIGKRYKFTLKDDEGNVIAKKSEIKKMAQLIMNGMVKTFATKTY